MKTSGLLLVLLLGSFPAFAMKNLKQNFPDSCDVVWKAAISVAKTQDYRIVSVDHEDQIISLASGGAWWGERLMTLSLQAGDEGGCVAIVQSRFSGLLHSDGPDLLARVSVDVIKTKIDPESKAFRRFTKCMGKGNGFSTRDCLAKLQKEIAKQKPQPSESSKPKAAVSSQDPGARDWWNIEKKPDPSSSHQPEP